MDPANDPPRDWPLRAHARRIRARHDWWVVEHGVGPEVLLLHGAGGSGHSFRARKRLADGEAGTEQQIVDAVARFVDGLAPSTILGSGKWPQPTKVALLAAPAVPLGSPVATTVATASLPRRWSG